MAFKWFKGADGKGSQDGKGSSQGANGGKGGGARQPRDGGATLARAVALRTQERQERKHIPAAGPRVKAAPYRMTGKVLDWKGKYGWIAPDNEIQHEQAGAHNGRIYFAAEDVEDDLDGVGSRVSFFVYSDGTGLGASNLRPATTPIKPTTSARTDRTPPGRSLPGAAPGKKGKGKGKGKPTVEEYIVDDEESMQHDEHNDDGMQEDAQDEDAADKASKRPKRGERREGDWDCPECGKLVFASKTECFSCGAPKAGEPRGGGSGRREMPKERFGPPDQTKRTLINEDPITGIVVGLKANGQFAWVEPETPVEHKLAQDHQGQIYLHVVDMEDIDTIPPVGSQIIFFVYEDENGLGAEHCQLLCEGTGELPEELAEKMAKMEAKSNKGKAAKGGSKGDRGRREREDTLPLRSKFASSRASEGKGRRKGKHDRGKGPSGPDLPRERVSEYPITGEVHMWKANKYGFITPSEPFDHEKAKGHGGKIYIANQDVEEGCTLEVGMQVTFHVYCDANGLGAEECMG